MTLLNRLAASTVLLSSLTRVVFPPSVYFITTNTKQSTFNHIPVGGIFLQSTSLANAFPCLSSKAFLISDVILKRDLMFLMANMAEIFKTVFHWSSMNDVLCNRLPNPCNEIFHTESHRTTELGGAIQAI